MEKIEFFIDTYSNEAESHVMQVISTHNSADADEVYHMDIINVHRELEETTCYFHVKGSWEAYKLFTDNRGKDLDILENKKYFYSLTHYEED